MTELDEGLEKWLKQVESATKLSINDQAEITGAGAKAYSEILKKNTPMSTESYSSARSVGHTNAKHGKKPRKSKHLRDSITYKAGFTMDGMKSGDTSVGFDSPYEALVARFVNNGTARMSAKQIKNMHFKDRSEVEATRVVLEAEASKYKEVTGL